MDADFSVEDLYGLIKYYGDEKLLNWELQTYNLTKIPVYLRGKGLPGVMEMLGVGRAREIYGYDREAFGMFARGTSMMIWKVDDYEKLKRGEYNNYWGHTFLFKSYNMELKKLFYWDQRHKSIDDDMYYKKSRKKDDFANKVIIGFKYYKEYYDLEDIINVLKKER